MNATPRRPVGRPRKSPVAGLAPNAVPRPVGRPRSPVPLRTFQIKIADHDRALLGAIAQHDAGPGGVPSLTSVVLRLVRAEAHRLGLDR